MSIEDEVREFCADVFNIPLESVQMENDVLKDFDWSKSDYGERSSEFLEDYLGTFRVITPNQSFRKYKQQNRFNNLLTPFYFLKFHFFDRQPMEVTELTVADLVTYAKDRAWP